MSGGVTGSSMNSGENLARRSRAREAWFSGQAWLASRRSLMALPTALRVRVRASSSISRSRPPTFSLRVRNPSSTAFVARTSVSAGLASPIMALTSTGRGEPPRKTARGLASDLARQSSAAVSRAKARAGGGMAGNGVEARGLVSRAGATVSRAVARYRREAELRVREAGASPRPMMPLSVSIWTSKLYRASIKDDDVRKGRLNGTATLCHSIPVINIRSGEQGSRQ